VEKQDGLEKEFSMTGMNFITEPQRQTPIVAEVDVAVVGGGTAGILAAVAAARTGAQTLLVERYGHLGGYFACQPGGAFGQSFQDMKGNVVIQGLPWEFMERLIAAGGAVGPKDIEPPEGKKWHIGKSRPVVHYEAVKTLAFEMMEEEGVRLLLHTLTVDAIVQDHTIKGVIVENKSGRQAILAKVIVDSSGDADVAAYAGAQFEKTPKQDMYQIQRGFKVAIRNERGRPEILGPPDDTLRIHYLNAAYNHGDGSDAWDLTRAEVEIRKRALQRLKELRKRPGYETAYIFETGESPLLGVRETRRIVGEYMLTEQDVQQGQKFADTIAKSAQGLDMHNSASDDRGESAICLPCETDYYDIPYRCLLPKQIDHLLVAGRCISATHIAEAATRKVPNCMATGQAAGTAAALAVQLGVAPGKLDVALLQKTLREQGANV
jgi:hypothetical protein